MSGHSEGSLCIETGKGTFMSPRRVMVGGRLKRWEMDKRVETRMTMCRTLLSQDESDSQSVSTSWLEDNKEGIVKVGENVSKSFCRELDEDVAWFGANTVKSVVSFAASI